MKLLQELLALHELAPEAPGRVQPEQKVGHESTPPNADKQADPDHPSPDDTKGEKPQHDENAKEKLAKLFSAADEANELKVYKRQDVFDIRQVQDGEQVHTNYPGEVTKTSHAKEGQYVVRKSEEVNKMKLIDSEDFDEKYELVNPNEKPDAEGFASYRLKSEVVAFQYHEKDLLDLNVSGHFIKIKPEDYIGHPLDNAKKLIVMSKADFEAKFRLS
jgi:hypothetical protein